MAKKNTKANGSGQRIDEPRINDEIRYDGEVRLLIDQEDGTRTSNIVTMDTARFHADKRGLDLIEIQASAKPPVVLVADYGKWLYERKKKAKENRQAPQSLKEIQLTANIGKNDMEVKARKVREFVGNGSKVKVVLRLKRREADRMEESKRSLYEFMLMVSEYAVAESMPKDEGNRSTVILKQKK